jgi:predicted GNAT family acetyltransferase
MSEAGATRVARNDDRHRYEASIDGRVVGFSQYRLRPGQVIFTHTEIEPEYEGLGIGSALASAALDDVRSRGERVVPLCPFIAGYIKRHPAYRDLVDETS